MPVSFPLAIIAVLFRRFLDSFHCQIPRPENPGTSTTTLVLLSGVLYYLYNHISRGMLVKVGHRPKQGLGGGASRPHVRRSLQNNLSRIFKDFTNRRGQRPICNFGSPSTEDFLTNPIVNKTSSVTMLIPGPPEVRKSPPVQFARELTPIIDDKSIHENDASRTYTSQFCEPPKKRQNGGGVVCSEKGKDLVTVSGDKPEKDVRQTADKDNEKGSKVGRKKRRGRKAQIKPIVLTGGVSKNANKFVVTKNTRSGKTYGNFVTG